MIFEIFDDLDLMGLACTVRLDSILIEVCAGLLVIDPIDILSATSCL